MESKGMLCIYLKAKTVDVMANRQGTSAFNVVASLENSARSVPYGLNATTSEDSDADL